MPCRHLSSLLSVCLLLLNWCCAAFPVRIATQPIRWRSCTCARELFSRPARPETHLRDRSMSSLPMPIQNHIAFVPFPLSFSVIALHSNLIYPLRSSPPPLHHCLLIDFQALCYCTPCHALYTVVYYTRTDIIYLYTVYILRYGVTLSVFLLKQNRIQSTRHLLIALNAFAPSICHLISPPLSSPLRVTTER